MVYSNIDSPMKVKAQLFLFILLNTLHGQVDYTSQIDTIFTNNCTSCHMYGNASGGLNLTSYSGVMTNSNSGASVVPGDHANSLLWQKVNSGQMPPQNNPDLTSDEVDLIAQWIDEGALPEPDEPLLGDVNEDGTVNILDIVQLANMILSDDYQESADLNGDGNLNILDIVQLVNIILGG